MPRIDDECNSTLIAALADREDIMAAVGDGEGSVLKI